MFTKENRQKINYERKILILRGHLNRGAVEKCLSMKERIFLVPVKNRGLRSLTLLARRAEAG
jgi:hypothetical protein